METIDRLAQIRTRHPAPPPAASDAEAEALARFATFFSNLASDRVETLVPQTYADDVYFNDTLKAVEGRSALGHYLGESAEAVESCRVEILETTRTANDEHLIRWRMMIRFKKFRRGVDTWTVGMSHLRFDAEGRVVYHQDYWNAADGLFQHIPVLGTLIALVKRRL
ncbi:nuclear transport factor 2 family protein [Arenimonas alkanexedens]